MIIGADRSAIGTLVERTTRFTMLLHLPRMAGYGVQRRVKNGPALAGYGADAMRDAIAARITTPPMQLRQSLTWDRDKELAQHAQLSTDTGLRPTSPTRTAHGSGARTRTRTGCSGNTSPKEPTSPDGVRTRSTPWPRR